MGGISFGRGRLRGMSKAEMLRHLIAPDPKSAWERVFDEPFEPIWKKEVKGYSFVGAHWHERSVWQGAFTSVGTASLRYLACTYNEFMPEGFENTTVDGSAEAWRLNNCYRTWFPGEYRPRE